LADAAKPVRSASWDPTGKYLVTASCDGKLRIYDTSGTTPALLKIMEGVIAPSESEWVVSAVFAATMVADDSSLISCYAMWHPSGAYFAIPTRINGACDARTD
jgi:chromosome transmission fidelity protein 4